jgi:hypothetical protein
MYQLRLLGLQVPSQSNVRINSMCTLKQGNIHLENIKNTNGSEAQRAGITPSSLRQQLPKSGTYIWKASCYLEQLRPWIHASSSDCSF